jgi:lysophospholipase L1-like esterase
MPSIRNVALVAGGLAVAGSAGAMAHASRQIMAPAKGNPAEFLSQPRVPGQHVTVCLGASMVHGRVCIDFVDLLRQCFPAPGYAFVNAGVNGDLAWNALQRLPSVIECDPDAVVVLVGTNDILASLSDRVAATAVKSKHLPVRPSLPWYGENLSRIVFELQAATQACIALCSLPPLGENLASEAGVRVAAYNAVIKDVAQACGAAYLPVYEWHVDYLAALRRTEGIAYADRPAVVMGAALEHYLLGHSWDEISARHNLVLTTDQIHPNSTGAAFIVEEIARFLSRPEPA